VEGEEEVEDKEAEGVAEAEVSEAEEEEEEGVVVVDLIIAVEVVEEGVGEGLEEVEGDGTDSLNWSDSRLIVSPILGIKMVTAIACADFHLPCHDRYPCLLWECLCTLPPCTC
jgi:hypothetical protein